jgi:hypothetical protein
MNATVHRNAANGFDFRNRSGPRRRVQRIVRCF